MNDITGIISQLEHQRQAIDKAISALREVDSGSGSATPTKRGMSAAGRKRISEATKARWAAKRAAESESQPKKRKLSAAARKRIAEAQRKRWAAIKGQAETPKNVAATKKGTAKKAAKKASRNRKAATPAQVKAVAASAT